MARRLRLLSHGLGFDIRGWPVGAAGWAELVDQLRRARVTLVIDGGANTGQYAATLRRAGYDGRILSVEPLPTAHAVLCRRAAGDRLWDVAPPLALGSGAGDSTLYVSAESDMSSLLAQRSDFARRSPSSAVERQERVAVTTLAHEWERWVRPGERVFVKLDVQGGEAAALDGAAAVMERIAGWQIELSLTPLYEGEAPWRQIADHLAAAGFRLCQVIPGYYDRRLGRMVQFDGVFFRTASDAGGAHTAGTAMDGAAT
ncbi:MAG: FkbM family methyltransferase [Alphaproteobacteria bacterium]